MLSSHSVEIVNFLINIALFQNLTQLPSFQDGRSVGQALPPQGKYNVIFYISCISEWQEF